LERRLRALGFASPTGLIANEATGRVADAKTLEQRQLLALGVEGVEVTPIELAVAYMKLARADETSAHRVVFDGLAESTEQGLGKLATPDNLRISGKTGTARDSDGTGTHAWFVGFAPAKSPQIVVLVFLETGRGSTDAAVVARELFQFYADAHR
jgi:cell division protein FtsI/penicillin-binding protein 2